ncbi:MAG: hypothetical protein KDD43_02695, partial [Bdellovibrionales bacterium]|nr:hypothetical protein [Bdellovibrionales bacterium]
DFQRFIGLYQRDETRLLPNPISQDDLMVVIGKKLFNSPTVGCAGCHPSPSFTDKKNVYNQNRAFPPVVSPTFRDNIHTLVSADRLDSLTGFVRVWDADDKGRIEEFEGSFVSPALRGLWARPPVFLHHGRAVSLREVLATPGHMALHPYAVPRQDIDRPGSMEVGLNELNGVPDTHGVTSHLSVWEMECLLRFVESIE